MLTELTVAELIEQLQRLNLPNAKATVYESDPDDFLPVMKVEIADNGNEVRLHSAMGCD